MVVSNRERIGNALESLKAGLTPYVVREMQREFGKEWESRLPVSARSLDSVALLNCMWEHWHAVFSQKLGNAERNYISELRGVRNKWAHQEPFTLDDAYRALDTAHRLLRAVSAPQADEVEHEMQEIMRARFEEQAKQAVRRAATAPIEGRPAEGLKPWRSVVTPHQDVASGRYQQAEFAADLGQVHRGQGSDEYRDPPNFFERTFLTEGLRALLANAILRLSGAGGDPVVKLQTNFGGGKTHAMIALYHLCMGVRAADLPGADQVLAATTVAALPTARRAVLVGTALSPSVARVKPDGTMVNTLWGELAWQLGGTDGYNYVVEADKAGVSPGSDALRRLFAAVGPSLILIDEWVAYARNLYGNPNLPGGTFDANMTFAQSLTEAAIAADRVLVVASIPASDIEKGGEAGKLATDMLENIFRRVQNIWQPATTEEGFEIVRRRLFQPITDPVARDAVARKFAEMYRTNAGDFPADCREAAYERRIVSAYPIHPHLFDDLFEKWSSLERFQRTRGVLQLMAKVVHTLWERGDANLLILPSTVPLDEPTVASQLTSFFEESWMPVIEADVDGPNALPVQLDRDNAATLGRFSACRRVARSVYLGSAPTLNAANRGVEERDIKVACVQPGENIATFGDALRRLTDRATYLYGGEGRYWYGTQPSVARLAQERATQFAPEEVLAEIRRRLSAEARKPSDFVRVHVCPVSSGDVPDDAEARLVILDPECTHGAREDASAARQMAGRILDTRGPAARTFRNMLVFLASDTRGMESLEQAVRSYLAWDSIWAQRGETGLNLDAAQQAQSENKRREAGDIVAKRIPEAYNWLLVPAQEDPRGTMEWLEYRLQGDDALAPRASRKLRAEEGLLPQFAGIRLRLELDRIPLWKGADIPVRDLWNLFATYLYLPRLRDQTVLLNAIRDGMAMITWETDGVAYAEGWDEATKRYLGLRAGESGSVIMDAMSRVVAPPAAKRQLELVSVPTPPGPGPQPPLPPGPGPGLGPTPPLPPPAKVIRHFHGSVRLNPMQPTGDVGTIAQEVLKHLTGIMGSEVTLTLEIDADIPNGIPDNVVRTVLENAVTLKFATKEFDEG